MDLCYAVNICSLLYAQNRNTQEQCKQVCLALLLINAANKHSFSAGVICTISLYHKTSKTSVRPNHWLNTGQGLNNRVPLTGFLKSNRQHLYHLEFCQQSAFSHNSIDPQQREQENEFWASAHILKACGQLAIPRSGYQLKCGPRNGDLIPTKAL